MSLCTTRIKRMTTDEQIGKNLAVLRGEMSQKDLADTMRKRGFKWSQATVWSVEKGERPLRLAEAEQLADLLTRSIDVLLAEDGEALVHAFTRQVRERHDAVLEALQSYDDARGHLALALDRIPDADKTGHLRIATDWVTQTADQVVDGYRYLEASEFAAMLARLGITQNQYELAGQRDLWLDRYNRAQQAFREASDHGKHQTEA